MTNRSLPFSLVLGVLFVALGATALAQEAKPKLESFLRLTAGGSHEPVAADWDVLPGGVVWVGGTNFSDEVKFVKVMVDDQEALVLTATVEKIQFMLPQEVSAGNRSVKVEVDGRMSNALTLKIAEKNQKNIDRIAARDAKEFEDPSRGEIERQVELLSLSVPSSVSERGLTLIRFSGKAQLPEGCVIALDLKLDGQPVGNAEAEILSPYSRTQDNFQGQFGPFNKRMFSGNYTVEANFRLADQPAKVRYRFRQELDRRELAKLSTGYARNFVFVGNPTQEELEKEQLRAHFRKTTEQITGLLDDLEVNFSVAGRADPRWHRGGGDVDEAAWQDWLKKRSLKGMPSQQRDDWMRRIRAHGGHLTSSGDFDEAGWREWLDHSWREEVLALYKSHRAYADTWQVLRFHDQVLEMEALFGALIKLSQNRASYLYEAQGLQVHPNDMRPQGADELRLGVSYASPVGIRRTVNRVLTEIGIGG
jgi:hypothetical protein